VYLRLQEAGFRGGMSIVKEYVRQIRPPRTPAFLTLSFAPGECAQVDWGQFGSINVGNTRRRLSFFVMVLCYSRMLYVEFTVSETMEHFMACHANAFTFFGGIPAKLMIDNLRSAVLQRIVGQEPVFNPRYKDFADHFGFAIAPCGVGAAHEKGRVENAVGYVKKNLLAGLELADFAHINPAARQWLDTVANVRTCLPAGRSTAARAASRWSCSAPRSPNSSHCRPSPTMSGSSVRGGPTPSSALRWTPTPTRCPPHTSGPP
jgi:transposase